MEDGRGREQPLVVSGYGWPRAVAHQEQSTYFKHPRPRTLEGSGSNCVKYLTFLSNFFFSLLALVALAAGLWRLAVKRSPENSWGGALPADPMLVLVLGGLVVSVVSLSGCLGALCENSCLLRFYCGAVLSCLMLEALAGTLVVALWGPLQEGLKNALHAAIIHYRDDPDLCFLLDQVQLGLQCCGVVSYQDWQQNLYFNCSSPGVQACSLPASCCINPQEGGALVNTQCGFGVLHLDQNAAGQVVHLQGCWPVLQQWLRGNMQTIGGCVITVVAIQGAELLLVTCLLRALAVLKTAEDTAEKTLIQAKFQASPHLPRKLTWNRPLGSAPGPLPLCYICQSPKAHLDRLCPAPISRFHS